LALVNVSIRSDLQRGGRFPQPQSHFFNLSALSPRHSTQRRRNDDVNSFPGSSYVGQGDQRGGLTMPKQRFARSGLVSRMSFGLK
ncbi:MAG: hypothetical protein ABGZ24_13080, partial [Fuerstiella sp.]